MKILNSFTELVELDLYAPVIIFTGPDYKMYRKVGYRSEKRDIVILNSDHDVKGAIGITKYDFIPARTFITGKYDSEFIGKLILEKLDAEINSVKETYLTSN